MVSTPQGNLPEHVRAQGLQCAIPSEPRVQGHSNRKVLRGQEPAHGPLNPADVDAHEHKVIGGEDGIPDQNRVMRILFRAMTGIETDV